MELIVSGSLKLILLFMDCTFCQERKTKERRARHISLEMICTNYSLSNVPSEQGGKKKKEYTTAITPVMCIIPAHGATSLDYNPPEYCWVAYVCMSYS